MHDSSAQNHISNIFALMFDYRHLVWLQHLERLVYILDPLMMMMFQSFRWIFLWKRLHQLKLKTNNKHNLMHSTQHTRLWIATLMTACNFDNWCACYFVFHYCVGAMCVCVRTNVKCPKFIDNIWSVWCIRLMGKSIQSRHLNQSNVHDSIFSINLWKRLLKTYYFKKKKKFKNSINFIFSRITFDLMKKNWMKFGKSSVIIAVYVTLNSVITWYMFELNLCA